MTIRNKNTRRDFLRNLGGTLCAGGASAFLPQLNLIGSALASSPGAFTDYRALVCIYLAGGNDAWNMLIPRDAARHAVYAASRSGIYNATTNPNGLGIDLAQLSGTAFSDAANGNLYALHPSMVELRNLYNSGKVAILPNIGTLVAPIDKATYNSTPALRPPQLYSHSDQENQWQLGQTQVSGEGWGGQVADRVRLDNVNQGLSPCISLSGSNRFQVGTSTFPYQMSSNGVSALSGVYNNAASNGGTYGAQRAAALDQMLGDATTSPLQGEYARVFKRSRDLYDLLSTALTGSVINTTFPANNSLGDQLKMVARMIKLSRDPAGPVAHKRQVYYVRLGGFDLHDGLIATHTTLLQRVSQAMNAFYTSLGEIGPTVQNEVTAFTMSEFARTLQSNGNGSDHAWGGVQMVMGGRVNGSRLYGTFPDQVLNNPMSFTRGQTIPTTSVDQMGSTLARWLGVTDSIQLNAIFPNLTNFPTSDLGFMLPG